MKAAPAASDFSEVRGQPDALDACVFAVARRSHLLLSGPPGCGKTMIARRVSGLLSLTDHAHRWLAAEYEGAGLGGVEVRVPFRAPHHTISQAALVGATPRTGRDLIFCRCKSMAPHVHHDLPRWVVPPVGEVGLARFGVLMLDEIGEFNLAALRALGGALRAMGDSAPMIVAAANRCGCGWFGNENRCCTCTDAQRARYEARVNECLRAVGGTFTIGYVDPVLFPELQGPVTHTTAGMRERIARGAGGAS